MEDKTLDNLKKLRSAVDGMIEVLEKENPTEDETAIATGKFVMILMELDALK